MSEENKPVPEDIEEEESSSEVDEPVVTEIRRLPPPKPKTGPSYGNKMQPKKKGILSGVQRTIFDSADHEMTKHKHDGH